MFRFKEITLQDKEVFSSYIFPGNRRNCDLAFSNLYCWSFLFNTRFTIYNGFLVFKFWIASKPIYMLPIGVGDWEDVLCRLAADAHSENKHFRMAGVCLDVKEKLEVDMPGRFSFASDRNYADYLYLREDLAGLRGKRFQPKRNHINKFEKEYPSFVYTPLTCDNFQDCLDLEGEWQKINSIHRNEVANNECRSIRYALENFVALGLTGGAIYVNNKIVAFTYGSPINKDTFNVHVEKADIRINGIYSAINYEFAKRIPERYYYVNREEDLGIEGLRKAKLSYHPVVVLEKFTARLTDEVVSE